MAARAVDKKSKTYLQTASPTEPLVKIQNNFTEMFLIMPSTKTANSTCMYIQFVSNSLKYAN